MYVCIIQLYVNIILVLATMHMAYARSMDTGKVRRYLLDSSAVVQKTSCHLQLSFWCLRHYIRDEHFEQLSSSWTKPFLACSNISFFCGIVVSPWLIVMLSSSGAITTLKLQCFLRLSRMLICYYAYYELVEYEQSYYCMHTLASMHISSSIPARIMFIHFVCLLWIPAVL